VTAITAKTIRRTLLTRLVLAGVVWLGGLHGAQAGVDVWTTTGPEGGTIRALAIDPQNPATLYAAVSRNASPDSSDVYKSTDAGSNWRAVAIGLSGSPQALAIDPQTPTTLYLRAYRRVYKSTDGGGRWTLVNTSLPGSYLSTQNLVIDPQTPTTLYAGTFGEGVFKSTDGGGSWNAVNTGLPTYPPGYYYPHSNVEALAIDPQTPTTLYLDMGGVYKSTDGGGGSSAGPDRATCVGRESGQETSPAIRPRRWAVSGRSRDQMLFDVGARLAEAEHDEDRQSVGHLCCES